MLQAIYQEIMKMVKGKEAKYKEAEAHNAQYPGICSSLCFSVLNNDLNCWIVET